MSPAITRTVPPLPLAEFASARRLADASMAMALLPRMSMVPACPAPPASMVVRSLYTSLTSTLRPVTVTVPPAPVVLEVSISALVAPGGRSPRLSTRATVTSPPRPSIDTLPPSARTVSPASIEMLTAEGACPCVTPPLRTLKPWPPAVPAMEMSRPLPAVMLPPLMATPSPAP